MKNNVISVRIPNPKDRKILEEAAERLGLKVSTYVRMRALEAAKKEGK